MTVDAAVLTELGRLRQRLPELTGSVLATADGLVVAHDAHGYEAETLAAMSAAHLGLARQFAATVGHGDLHETVVTCADGYITTYAAGDDALLTVITTGRANLARVHLEARRALTRVAAVLSTAITQPSPPQPAPDPRPGEPLARRGPTYVLPRQSAG